MDPVSEALKTITIERDRLAARIVAMELDETLALDDGAARMTRLTDARTLRSAELATLTTRIAPLELQLSSALGWRRHALRVGQEMLRALLGISGFIGWTMAITRGDLQGGAVFWLLVCQGASLWWLGNFANREEQSL